MSTNTIFAALLVAGITAWGAAFVSDLLVHPERLKQDAIAIEGGAVEGGGPAKAAGPEPILHLIATADVAKGEKLSKACAACHSFDQGGPNKVGPNLWGVVGAQKGHHAGFEYSSAMASFGGDWSYAELNKYLWKPKKHVPGTKMNYNGIKKPEDRAAMIAWLHTLGSSKGMPSDAEIAAEKLELAPEAAEDAGGAGASSEAAPAEAPAAH